MIKENLDIVEKKIQQACIKSGRDREEVKLIAVSKTKPISMIQEAIDAGIQQFGENKVQELTDKYESLPTDLQWHFIGHLQRNKVKYILGKTYLIHSLDSLRLAQQLEEEGGKRNITSNVLIEINVANEDSKYGITMEEALPFVEKISNFRNLKVKGLMTIAPFVENPEDNRIYFNQLHQLMVDIKSKNIDNIDMDILSMGMTGDYEVAIEEGATMVRIGTGIFGERNYNFDR